MPVLSRVNRRRLLAGLLPVLILGAAPPPGVVDYRLAPEQQGDAISALRVTARFVGDASGTTRFDWGDGWAGEDHLGQWARDIAVAGAVSSEPAPNGGRIIHAAPGAALTVTYRIVSAFSSDPGVADSAQAKPVVRPTWFYAVGEALFATPAGREDMPARFTWEGPATIGFASDLEHAHARPGLTVKTVDDITESIVIGGRDLRVTQAEAGGAPLRLATIGRYGFDIAAFEALARKTVASERSFWGSPDRQPFLITMTPIAPAPGHISYNGTGRSDAFALWMDPEAELSGLASLLAHEYFHSWNSRQLGALGKGDAEPESYWLSEGFTDFYARRLMLRAGLLTPDQFAASWNDALAAYAGSRYRTATNAAAAVAFWKDAEAAKLPYQRGAMLAAIWDWQQRRSGKANLDILLRDQRRRMQTAKTPPPVTSLFARVAAAHGLDIRRDVARYLDQGVPIMLPSQVFGRCASVDTITRPVFERGWDTAATSNAGNVVTGLEPDSPAHAAGLREGMKIIRRTAGTPGDARNDYVLVVSDGGAERTITFRPAGKATETLQQLVLDRTRFAADPRGCSAALAG